MRKYIPSFAAVVAALIGGVSNTADTANTPRSASAKRSRFLWLPITSSNGRGPKMHFMRGIRAARKRRRQRAAH